MYIIHNKQQIVRKTDQKLHTPTEF